MERPPMPWMGQLLSTSIVLSMPLWVGCSDPGPPGPGFSVGDSAGVTIATHSGSGREDIPVWRLDPDPELVIGQADGEEEYLLFGVRGGTFLDNRSTVVLISVINHFELRYYGPDGRHLTTVGRWGEGPGEMHFVRGLYRLAGDSVLVIGNDHRFAVFGPEGGRIRAGRLSLASPPGVWSGLLDPEHWAFQTGLGPTPRWGHVRYWDLYRIHDLTTGTTDTIARLGGSIQFNEIQGEGVSMGLSYPFTPASYGASGGGMVWVAQSDVPEIRGFGPEGNLVSILRLERAPREVTREDERRFEEDLMARPGSINSKRWSESALGRMGYPQTMPYFGHLKVDREGNLFVRRYEPAWAEGDQHWDAYDQAGRWIATLEIPPGTVAGCDPLGLCNDLMEIGDDYLLVQQRDSLGVRYVVRYRLIKGLRE